MRVLFDPDKSLLLQSNPRRGLGFEEAREIFVQPHYEDRRSDLPEQFRVVGWAAGRLYTLIYEVWTDEEGEFLWFVTLWKSTEEERRLYAEHL